VGVHKPLFKIKNLRDHAYIEPLGRLEDGTMIDNTVNFPENDLYEPCADIIYEIANAFPFRGTTYINSAWADVKAARPESIRLLPSEPCSLIKNFERLKKDDTCTIKDKAALLDILPHPLLIALAQASTDSEELALLAKKSCNILFDPEKKNPIGIRYIKTNNHTLSPDITDHQLFEVVVNNPNLPDDLKNTLVLKPGVQGQNEITGEYLSEDGNTHVFEYLRRNSYIPWGHFASNMANDAIRYSTLDLRLEDMKGIRHLYYQRTFVRLAQDLGIHVSDKKGCLPQNELEDLRNAIQKKLALSPCPSLEFNSTLWGWNFGFGYAQSGHRLHASHQMIHQQNAMVPGLVQTSSGQKISSFACGDLILPFVEQYRKITGNSFFETYVGAIKNNTRTDGKEVGESSLVLMEDDHTLLFAPKAPVSEWELQLMPKTDCGNILEADIHIRDSLDRAILTAVKVLESLGVQMVTTIEFSKRFDSDNCDQRLLYSFLPKLPHAPATFSEAQSRWISGCYPEDFAHAGRLAINRLNKD